ncbi:hypothetical protein [Sphingobacterium sp.]|uniref:hypothetical protein n=1 Tax=Sphingobacterium sp. TaxID=341027 RepID=UPI00289E68A0|nr:hypothetical protein [Sphingobacterium sp.]
MKRSRTIIILKCVLFIITGCKKESQEQINEEAIAAKYGLKKVELKSGEVPMKKFSNAEEMDLYFQKRFGKNRKLNASSKGEVVQDLSSVNVKKQMASNGKLKKYGTTVIEDDGVPGWGGNLFTPTLFVFSNFAQALFPDHVQCELFPSAYAHTIWYTYPNFGTYTYQPFSGREQSGVYYFNGVYTEIYGGGIFNWSQTWQFKLEVTKGGLDGNTWIAAASYTTYD